MVEKNDCTVIRKPDFVKELVKRGIVTSQKQGAEVVEGFLDTLFDCLYAGKKVSFIGRLKFEPVTREAREGTNPQTKEKIYIPAKKGIHVTVGKEWKDQLNK